MKKRLFSILMVTALVATVFSGCANKTAKGNAGNKEEASDEFVITNDNIKVAQYKGLSVDVTDTTATDDDVNSYIDYVLQYAYSQPVDVEEVDTTEAETNTDETKSGTDETKTDTNEAEASDVSTEEESEVLTHEDLTDELVSTITNGDYTNVEEYKKYIKNVVEEENKHYSEESAKQQLFQQVVQASEVLSYSEEELNNYKEYAKSYYSDYADYLGVDIETFYKENMGYQTEEEYNNFIEEEAKSNLKTEYIILAIADAENIEVTDADVDAEIQNYIDNGYFETKEAVLDYISRDEITVNLKYYKVLDVIYKSAKSNVIEREESVASTDIIPEDAEAAEAAETDAEAVETNTEDANTTAVEAEDQKTTEEE